MIKWLMTYKQHMLIIQGQGKEKRNPQKDHAGSGPWTCLHRGQRITESFKIKKIILGKR